MDKRVQKTRAAIRKAYLELLSEKKTTRMSVTELTKRANINRKTFYLHYVTTDDVMYDYHQQLIQKFISLLGKQELSMSSLCFAVNQMISQNLEFFRQITMTKDCERFWEQSCESLMTALCHAYKNKVTISEKELHLYSRFILAGMLEIYKEWLKGNLPFTMEEIGKIVSQMAFNGVAPILKSEEENHD